MTAAVEATANRRPTGEGDTLADVKRQLEEAGCFEKSLPKSLFYLAFDGAVIAALIAYRAYLPYVVYANLLGFFLWCMFVVGHDCGHTTFSNYTVVNDIVGLFSHGMLGVPYYAWQESHRQHHMYHNHSEKDKSHGWWITSRRRFDPALFVYLFPFTTFYLYLAGVGDGSHIFPFCKFLPQWKSFASTVAMFALPYAISHFTTNFFWDYFVPLLIFNFWLMVVTFLQHHCEYTQAYSGKQWNFHRGAMQTVDRKYGAAIDVLSHNITDGHIAHHMFFTKIPHYHLTKATQIIYKSYDNVHFVQEIPYIGWVLSYYKYLLTTMNTLRVKGEGIYVPWH